MRISLAEVVCVPEIDYFVGSAATGRLFSSPIFHTNSAVHPRHQQAFNTRGLHASSTHCVICHLGSLDRGSKRNTTLWQKRQAVEAFLFCPQLSMTYQLSTLKVHTRWDNSVYLQMMADAIFVCLARNTVPSSSSTDESTCVTLALRTKDSQDSPQYPREQSQYPEPGAIHATSARYIACLIPSGYVFSFPRRASKCSKWREAPFHECVGIWRPLLLHIITCRATPTRAREDRKYPDRSVQP